MTQDLVLKLGDVAIYYCAVISLIFIVIYTVLARWWRSEFGRHLFFFMLTIAFAFLYIVVLKIFGRFEGWEWFRLALIGLLAFVLTWRVWILVRVQIHARYGE